MIERSWFERHPWWTVTLLAALVLFITVMLEIRDNKIVHSIKQQQQLEHDYVRSLHTDYPVGESCYEDGSCDRSTSIPR